MGFVFKHATQDIRCSSAGAGGYQTALHYCNEVVGSTTSTNSVALPFWIGGELHVFVVRPIGPYRGGSVRIHVPCPHIYNNIYMCVCRVGLQRFVDVIDYVDYKNMSISMECGKDLRKKQGLPAFQVQDYFKSKT